MKDRIEKIITHYSSAVGEWINADGEGIETDDAYYDEDDLKIMVTELVLLFESQKKEYAKMPLAITVYTKAKDLGFKKFEYWYNQKNKKQ